MPAGNRKRIALAVCGGIAAYKAADLTSRLVKLQYEVFPLMTEKARDFLGPLTLEALTGNPVLVGYADGRKSGAMDHITLMKDTDLLVVAPATANTIAKCALGFADNFIAATYLANRHQTLFCPAMNTGMLEHPATQRNMKQLQMDGVELLFGASGNLACGDVGPGRMAEPEDIMETIERILSPKKPIWQGVKALITAGPTCEDLDPVRFLTNKSTGAMGFALARTLSFFGAEVVLIHGPTVLKPPPVTQVIPVRSAAEMAKATLTHFPTCDVAIMTAAVADFSPQPLPQKLKKIDFDGHLALNRTTDILAELGKRKESQQLLVGFAAETENLLAHAREKKQRKNVDWMFANDVSKPDTGFGDRENHLIALGPKEERDLGRHHKHSLAAAIAECLETSLKRAPMGPPPHRDTAT
jgi:phosphopantothenoylcysteine decarboxylase/phosphopantothenate--cysteine ligase